MPGAGNPQALNRYSYVLNNPIRYRDPSGHIPLDWLIDGVSVSLSAAQFAADPTWENAGWLALDIALAVVPYVPAGVGLVRGAARAANVAGDIANTAGDLARAANAANNGDNIGEGIRILYHGTNSPAANAIRSSGIDLSVQRVNLDFNPTGRKGFYMTNDYQQALEWAQNRARTRGGEPDIVTFAVPEKALRSLNGKVFSAADPEWASFVTSGRRGTLSHDFDYVEGPMLANPGR